MADGYRRVVRALRKASERNAADGNHLIVRRHGLFCTVCGCTEPIHPGDGTPAGTFIFALQAAMLRHPESKHDTP